MVGQRLTYLHPMKILPQCGASLSFVRPIIASLIGLSGMALAQTAPSASPKPEETIMLSPFEVRTERDVGYQAASTLAGGRINTDLKDTSAAISVLNRQFLDDISSTSITDAMEWSVNAAPGYDSGLTENGSNFRGANFSFYSRNYFIWYLPSDSYNMERFEFSRGPNGVLYGDGNLGGIATAQTKRAYLGRKKGSVTARVDSFGGYRLTTDLSIPAGDRMAFRLNLLDSQLEGWRDHSKATRYGVHLAGIVKLDERSNVRFEGEWGSRDRERYVTVYNDNASYWNGTTVYDGITAPVTTGAGITRVDTAANHFVNILGQPAAGYSNWATFYRTTGPNIAIQPDGRSDIPVSGPTLPNREFNLNSPDNIFKLRYYTYSGFIDRKFSDDFYVELGVSRSMSDYDTPVANNSFLQYYLDINKVLPNGQTNPNFGKPYAEVQRLNESSKNTVTEIRALSGYKFETSWMKGNISAIVGTRSDIYNNDQARMVRTNGLPKLTDSSNLYYERRYWDTPTDVPVGTPDIPGYTFGYVLPTSAQAQRKFVDSAQIASVNKFFDDRVTFFLGGRYDKVYQTQRVLLTGAAFQDPVTGIGSMGANIIPEGEKAARDVAGAKSVVDVSTFSKNAGLVYYPVKWLGVFANISQTFATPNAGHNLIDGSAPGISRSEGFDYGVRVSLADGKLYADLRHYAMEQKDQLTGTGAATQINAIWNRLGRTEMSGLSYRDTQDLEADGYEFELTANPTRNIRLIANYGLPRKAENVNALPGLRAYYEKYHAEWEAAAVTDTTIATNLATINTTLANNATFATQHGTWKYKASIYGTYTFTDTAAKGLSLGLGANFFGRIKVGNAATAFDYRYSNAYYLVTTKISYDMRIKGYPVTFQLNVNNLLDYDDLITTSYVAWRQGGVTTNPTYYIPGNFRYPEPRQFIFSTTVKF